MTQFPWRILCVIGAHPLYLPFGLRAGNGAFIEFPTALYIIDIGECDGSEDQTGCLDAYFVLHRDL